MGNRFGEEVEDEDAGDDQEHADDGREVEGLLVEDEADDGEEGDADAGPDGIGDANGHGAENQ